jgi:hypothetical protein
MSAESPVVGWYTAAHACQALGHSCHMFWASCMARLCPAVVRSVMCSSYSWCVRYHMVRLSSEALHTTAHKQELIVHLCWQHCSPQMLRPAVPSRLCPCQCQVWALRCYKTQPQIWQVFRQCWDAAPAAPWWVCCWALQDKAAEHTATS